MGELYSRELLDQTFSLFYEYKRDHPDSKWELLR